MNKFKTLRKKANLTQVEFAKAMDVKQSTVSSWENGNRRPPIKKITKLAKILNVSEIKIFECFK